jgi:hypothetical protein
MKANFAITSSSRGEANFRNEADGLKQAQAKKLAQGPHTQRDLDGVGGP